VKGTWPEKNRLRNENGSELVDPANLEYVMKTELVKQTPKVNFIVVVLMYFFCIKHSTCLVPVASADDDEFQYFEEELSVNYCRLGCQFTICIANDYRKCRSWMPLNH